MLLSTALVAHVGLLDTLANVRADNRPLPLHRPLPRLLAPTSIVAAVRSDPTTYFRVEADVYQNELAADVRTHTGFSYYYPRGLAMTRSLVWQPPVTATLRPHWDRRPRCRDLDPVAATALGVRYLVCRGAQPPRVTGFVERTSQRAAGRTVHVMENTRWRSPIRFYPCRNVRHVATAPGPAQVRHALVNDLLLLPPASASTAANPCAGTVASDAAGPTSVALLDSEHGRFELGVNNTVDGYIFIPENGHPGWRARVGSDDATATSATVEAAFGAWLAIPLTAGSHHVTVYFEDIAFRIGLVVTTTTALVLSGLALVPLARRRARTRRQQERAPER